MFRRERIPNYITGLRIVGALILPWMQLFSVGFFILYSVCGVSDVADGVLARKMKVESDFGAKLDSVSDLLFYSVMMFKVVPYVYRHHAHYSVWVVAGITVAVRIISYLLVAFKYHRFAAIHTYANKLTGLAVFSLPYLLGFGNVTAVSLTTAVIGLVASSEELLIHATSKEYNPEKKSILLSNK